MRIVKMKIRHYNDVLKLWRQCDGIGLDRKVDNKNEAAIYLFRNAGLSFVAMDKRKVIGAVLCGHDGRRGYLYHLAVAGEYRKMGIGRRLVESAISKLRSIGVRKCHAFVFRDNVKGGKFWKSMGWKQRSDLRVISKDIAL
jgi:ribosomal protein S18 acetylase RimI-like enzyme